jgi:hypothetical protein
LFEERRLVDHALQSAVLIVTTGCSNLYVGSCGRVKSATRRAAHGTDTYDAVELLGVLGRIDDRISLRVLVPRRNRPVRVLAEVLGTADGRIRRCDAIGLRSMSERPSPEPCRSHRSAANGSVNRRLARATAAIRESIGIPSHLLLRRPEFPALTLSQDQLPAARIEHENKEWRERWTG